MKTSLLALTVASLAFGFSAAANAAPRVGQAAPDFTLTDANGQTHSLSDFAGKTVVLEWTNHQCPFVVKHYGADNMQGQQRTYTDQDVVWLVVNSSAPGKQGHVSPDESKQIMGDWRAANTAYLFDGDGTVGRAFAARTTPHMYVIDGEGILQYMGAIDSNPSANPADIPGATQYVAQALDAMAAGQPIPTPVTQPYGCSVKY